MKRADKHEAFGDFDPAEHAAEAEDRWGDSDAYRASARRARHYSKDDWMRFKAESVAVNEAVAALLDDGVPPGDPRAMDAVERHRLLVDRWYHPCPHEMHRQLGRTYVTDVLFTAAYEKVRAGMAPYLSDAIATNAVRAPRG